MQGAETAEAVTQLRNLYQHFKQRTLHLDRHVCAMMDARLPALVDMASVVQRTFIGQFGNAAH